MWIKNAIFHVIFIKYHIIVLEKEFSGLNQLQYLLSSLLISYYLKFIWMKPSQYIVYRV